jgi:hypothetical protein
MRPRPFRSGISIALVALSLAVFAGPAYSQAPTASWSGWAQCQIVVQGPGYTSRQTHSWEITGPATSSGAIQEYPATWTVAGDATIDTTDPQRTVRGTRRTEGSMAGARIGIFVRASDSRVVALLRSTQLSVAGGTTGTQQIALTGSPAPPTQSFTSAVYEWRPLPPIEDVSTSTHLSGTGVVPVNTRLDPLQPASATGQAVCTWDFVRGGQASALPRPGASDGAAVRSTQPTTSQIPAATTRTISSPSGIVKAASAPAPRTIALAGFSGTGTAGAVPPRTLSLAGFSGTGMAGVVPPRTISLAGFTGAGMTGAVPPRTIALAGFAGTGAAGLVPPRTIPLAGFSGRGSAGQVPPRTISLSGFIGIGVAQ